MANGGHIEKSFLAIFFWISYCILLLYFRLRRAAAFVSSPMHLFLLQYSTGRTVIMMLSVTC